MGELFDYIKERYMKSDNTETKELMQKQMVKNSVLQVCESKLEDSNEILTFEVLPKDLPYMAEIINEEPLVSKFQIYQKSETLFQAKLRELEL